MRLVRLAHPPAHPPSSNAYIHNNHHNSQYFKEECSVKRHLGFGHVMGSVIGGAVVLAAVQPAQAASTQITDVQLKEANGGVQVVLQTKNGDSLRDGRAERPQVFTVNRGNSLIADIINTELQLPAGNGFLKNNPSPGISAVTVTQLDATSVRVEVSGDGTSPAGAVNQESGLITLNVNGSGTTPPIIPGAQNPEQVPRQPLPSQVAQMQTPPPGLPGSPVMVPNPGVTINGVPVNQNVPPSQPRAIAPPLGDQAVSNIDSSAGEINLGTNEVVPRLVLRDAPVRDVLSLLARAAGMNVAYVDGSVADAERTGAAPDQATPGATGAADTGVKISLDIENEPVQNVFNYVLRVAGLQANRAGRTIFVSPKLPDSARNIITRTLRLNQADAENAGGFLNAQGAETRILVERVDIQTVGEGAAARTIETRTPEIRTLSPDFETAQGPLLLKGLSVSVDPRLNSVTLVGEPRQIQIATSMLGQLDLRQRQVAVNVKIVDINLLANDNFSTSFSFGVGNGFFSVDGGAASLNYGRLNPATSEQARTSLTSPPTIGNPYAGSEPFLDATQQLTIPGGGGGVVDQGRFTSTDATFLNPTSPLGRNDNPLRPGIRDYEPGTPTVIARNAQTGEITFTQGEASTIETALPSLFQYPSRFLASLQAQVVSGNAKILTDPTLVIQEGQSAKVELGQEIITNILETRTSTGNETRTETQVEKGNAGLSLAVAVDRIDDNGFVTLNINPSVTSPFETRQVRLGNGGSNNITLLNRRDLNTGRLRLRDGQTLIVAGIIQDSDRTTISKVPILGDIPILGALFRSTQRDNSRREVIVLLTPQVLNDDDTSNFGYRYSPLPETQQLLQRQGVQTP
jgi:type IV pilus assembly protein PilQ